MRTRKYNKKSVKVTEDEIANTEKQHSLQSQINFKVRKLGEFARLENSFECLKIQKATGCSDIEAGVRHYWFQQYGVDPMIKSKTEWQSALNIAKKAQLLFGKQKIAKPTDN